MKPAYSTGTKYIHFFLPERPGRKVYIVGDFNHWQSRRPLRYSEVDQGYNFKLKARQDGVYCYKYIVDGHWMLDPRNPKKVTNGPFGFNSCAMMPDYREPAEMNPNMQAETGRIDTLEVKPRKLRTPRKVHVYRPPAVPDSHPLPLILLQDGGECVDHFPLPALFDRILHQKLCRPFMAVMVSPISPKGRDRDYTFNDSFEDFLATEVLSTVEKHYAVSSKREERAVFGFSLGGLVSVRTALRHPQIFGLAGGESSAFWPENGRIYTELIHQTPLSTRFYLGCGDMDGGEELSKLMAEIFKNLGVEHKLKISCGGHEWHYWCSHMRHSLQWFFPSEGS